MGKWIIGGVSATVALVLALMFGLPVYSVWQQEYSGRATPPAPTFKDCDA